MINYTIPYAKREAHGYHDTIACNSNHGQLFTKASELIIFSIYLRVVWWTIFSEIWRGNRCFSITCIEIHITFIIRVLVQASNRFTSFELFIVNLSCDGYDLRFSISAFLFMSTASQNVSFLLQRCAIDTKICSNIKKQEITTFLDYSVTDQFDTFRFSVRS